VIRRDADSPARNEQTVRGDIAIVGMSCTYPGARDVRRFWQNIVKGVDATSDVPTERWDAAVYYNPDPTVEDTVYCQRGGYLGVDFAFNPLKYGTMPRAVDGAEPDQFLVLRAVHEAMEDAGYLNREFDGTRTSFVLGRGSYLGAGLAGLLQRGIITKQTLRILKRLHPEYTDEQLAKIKDALRAELPGFCAETAPGLIPNITTGRVANRLNFMGPTFTVDAACASSLIAVELGVRDLLTGRFDTVLAGGIHIFSDVPFFQVFAAMGALSYSSTIRPFDKHCDGTLAGEGVGIVVLKRLADAERDGDRIYAVVKGVGSSSDGRAMSVTAPRVEGEELALRRAYEMSGVDPSTIELIEAHGTGTPVGDPTEIAALTGVFGAKGSGPRSCALGSIKSMIGHTMPAAGAAGLIKTALALYHRMLPPTLNCREPADELTRDDCRFYVNSETRPWVHGRRDVPRRAGVNAFGFGGVNVHVVLEEYVPKKAMFSKGLAIETAAHPTLAREWETELLVLQAESRDALIEEVRRIKNYAEQAEGVSLCDLAYTLNAALTDEPYRLTVVASSLANLAGKLDHAAARLGDPTCKQIKDAKGIFYFSESELRGGKVAFLFPGEGAQYLNMLGDLYPLFPEVQACFDAADRAVSSADRYPPSADIFPPPFFGDAERSEAEARLFKIERATEAVLTADAAMLLLLQRIGIQPDVITGHSAGEWIAMVASGMIHIDEFVGSMDRLDALYRDLGEDTTIPKMSMLAVGASREKVLALAAEIDRTVYIANDNCPHQVVIVVEPQDTDAVVKHLRQAQVFVEVLPFDRGYHTPVFTYICKPLREFFDALVWASASTTIYSCTTGAPYPADQKAILDVVSDTFAKPLLFRDTVTAMYESGARIFIEVGPRANLTGFVGDILRGSPHVAVPTNQHRRSGVTALNQALAMLAALHVPMDLGHLYERRTPKRLTFDPKQDCPVDERNAPGVINVSLAYPRLETELEPVLVHETTPAAPMPTYGERIAERSPMASARTEPSRAPVPAAGSSGGTSDFGLLGGAAPRTPLLAGAMQQHLQLMQGFLETQQQVMQAYLGGGVVQGAPVPILAAMPALPETEIAAVPPVHQVTEPVVSPLESSDAAERPDACTKEPAEPVAPMTSRGLEEVLIEIVSEKTGYPAEMLDLDLDMEAELGIDSIKRVEILGALQQVAEDVGLGGEFDMEEVSKLKTLRAVVEFLAPDLAAMPRTAPTPKSADHLPDASALPFAGRVTEHEPGSRIVVVRVVDLEEDLYLEDHCFDPPSSAWDADRDRLHVVPLTVSVEMMAEVAALLAPGKVVVAAKRVQAGKWIDVHRHLGPVEISIEATRVSQGDDVAVLIRRTDETNGQQVVAEATYVFADRYPDAPKLEPFALAEERAAGRTATDMYEERRMFHGPRFQGVVSLDSVGKDGLSAQLQVLPVDNLFASRTAPAFFFDPFLLDAAGQLVGYWPVEYLDEGFVLFPVRVSSITRYRDNPAPGERTSCRLRIRHVSKRQLRADMDIVAPDGSLWLRVEGWEDWRFYWDRAMYDFWRSPGTERISEAIDVPLPPGFEDVECRRLSPFGEMATSVWERLWGLLLLSREELAEFDGVPEGPRRLEWLHGRAAAKEAVRCWVKRHHGLDLFPADVRIRSDASGRPHVDGPWVTEIGERPQVSIAHKGTEAVAAAGRAALGIDLETVEARDASFDQVAFDDSERDILNRLNGGSRDEWVTRAWCAKEAAGKALGVGLSHGPGTMTLQSVDPALGNMIVGCGKPLEGGVLEEAAKAFVVHSVRDGDFVVALAVEERNGNGGL